MRSEMKNHRKNKCTFLPLLLFDHLFLKALKDGKRGFKGNFSLPIGE